jgi:GntR family transcriptional regulator/MocR family aminotransferase
VLELGAHDLLPGRPDLAAFPRKAWLASWRRALRTAPDRALGYPDPRGAVELRDAVSAYLGRARAVVPDPQRTVVTSGVTQAVALLCRVLRDDGHETLAVEDPGFHLHRWTAARAGLRPVGVRVDADGLDVGALAASGARAVLVTPAHQMPTGVVLSADRRAGLLEWARERDGVVIEDDYDAEFRYDRDPVGALQGLDPERVAYAGSASKALANGLRIGWVVLPERLARRVASERVAADGGGPAFEQLAFADLLARGEVDRHLRRTRRLYRARRDALVAAVGEHLPGATMSGVAAGLHVMVTLPAVAEEHVLEEARRAGIALHGVGELRVTPDPAAPAGVVLGYAHLSEPALVRAVAALGEAVARARDRA